MSDAATTPARPTAAKKDFMSDQVIRWCPGCGDYSILSQAQTVFAELGIPRENFVMISGIGCSSRFPYYVNTYGFHTIHGRAATIATGVKASRPELSVWVITGDGDALSIGGNHTAHLLRRNVDVQVLLFNNRIYGLTKGQYSPTSEVGKKTKSTPMGSLDHPFNPLAFALGCDATFIARSVDVFTKEQRDVMHAAAAHRGAAFVELLQNCNIFNDGAWDSIVEKSVRSETCLFLEAGKPMVFAGGSKGIRLRGLAAEVVTLGEGLTADDCLVHDPSDIVLAGILARMEHPAFPVPMGVIYKVDRPTYDAQFTEQIQLAMNTQPADLQKLLAGGDTWSVG